MKIPNNMELPYNQAVPLQGTSPEEVKQFNSTKKKLEVPCHCNISQGVGLVSEWAVEAWCVYAQWNIIHSSKDAVTSSTQMEMETLC